MYNKIYLLYYRKINQDLLDIDNNLRNSSKHITIEIKNNNIVNFWELKRIMYDYHV